MLTCFRGNWRNCPIPKHSTCRISDDSQEKQQQRPLRRSLILQAIFGIASFSHISIPLGYILLHNFKCQCIGCDERRLGHRMDESSRCFGKKLKCSFREKVLHVFMSFLARCSNGNSAEQRVKTKNCCGRFNERRRKNFWKWSAQCWRALPQELLLLHAWPRRQEIWSSVSEIVPRKISFLRHGGWARTGHSFVSVSY